MPMAEGGCDGGPPVIPPGAIAGWKTVGGGAEGGPAVCLHAGALRVGPGRSTDS